MAIYTKNTPGAPTSGKYVFGDSVKDSVGVTWTCVRTGMPGVFVPSVGAPEGTVVAPSLPSGVTSTMKIRDIASGGYHSTYLTLADTQIAVTDANAYGGTQILDFPEGRIYVIGCIAELQFGVIGTRASTINNSSTIDWGIGTATASNVTLATTMIDLAPAVDEQAVGDDSAYGAVGSSVLAAAAFFDGTGTAKDAFLNVAFSDNTDIDGNGILKVQGSILITWLWLGDK